MSDYKEIEKVEDSKYKQTKIQKIYDKMLAYALDCQAEKGKESKHWMEIILSRNIEANDFCGVHRYIFSQLVIYYDKRKDIPTIDQTKKLIAKKIETTKNQISQTSKKEEKEKLNRVVGELKSAEIVFSNLIYIDVISQKDLEDTIDELIEENEKIKLTETLTDYVEKRNVDDIRDDLIEITQYKNKKQTSAMTGFSYDEKTNNRFEYQTDKSLLKGYVPCGIEGIDKCVGGFRPMDLVYIAGNSGAGKSIFMLNFAYNMWKQHKNVIIVSMEILEDEYYERLDSLASKVPYRKIKTKDFDEFEKSQFQKYFDKAKQNIDDEGNTIDGKLTITFLKADSTVLQLQHIVNQFEKKYGIKYDVIVADYSGLLSPTTIPRDAKEHNMKERVSFELKQLAVDKKCIVLTGVQLNRGSDTNKFASASNIAGSRAIMHHVDFMFEIRIDQEKNDKYGSFIASKSRGSEKPRFDFETRYDVMSFNEVDSIEQIANSMEETINKKNVKGWMDNE